MKRLLKISPLCHGNLLHCIVNDIPVDLQLYDRLSKFLKHLYTTNNYCISLCARLAIKSSGSSVSNNLTVLSNVFHTPRCTLPEYEIDSDVSLEADYREKVAGNIRDSVLFLKHMYNYIYYLCLTVVNNLHYVFISVLFNFVRTKII